ncbi:hypothetical protein GW17_00059968 [Ensete ventricosum]|nr:hypothetical protein GW17_00059968 [Ensete ventricosum]
MSNCLGGRADLRVERKMAERYGRLHMKTLYCKLSSIIPAEHRTRAKASILLLPALLFHSCKRLAISTRIGLEASRVSEKLKGLVK